MTTAAIASKGTQLKRGDGGGTEVFTLIAEILEITGPEESMGTLDATSMDSAAKEFIAAGFVDGGEVTLNMHWIGNNAQHQGVRTDLRNGTKRNFQLLMPDTTLCTFAAFVTKLGHQIPAEGKITQSVTLKVTGLPTWAYNA
jgi:predicted secreted protein